jgi:hypothetical protein
MTYTDNTPRTQNTYTNAQITEAQALVEAHNNLVNPDGIPFCEKGRPGYFLIHTSGDKRVYFTLYRFNNLTLPGVNPFQYAQNLSTDLLTAVKKMCSGRGLPIILNDDENFNPKLQGTPVLGFGKHRGMTLDAVYDIAPNYVMWIANKFEGRNKQGRALKAHALTIAEAHYQMVTAQNQSTCNSRFQGQLKERVELELTVYNVTPATTDEYGQTSKPKFKAVDANENLYYFWSNNDFAKDDVIEIKGTVVGHREILGKQFTRLNRIAAIK